MVLVRGGSPAAAGAPPQHPPLCAAIFTSNVTFFHVKLIGALHTPQHRISATNHHRITSEHISATQTKLNSLSLSFLCVLPFGVGAHNGLSY